MQKDLNRRSFLKGAGVFGAGTLLAGGLAACAPVSGGTSEVAGGSADAAASGTFPPGAYQSSKSENIGIVREATSSEDVDVVVVGSGMGGFSAAMMVKEQMPDATVVMLEKNSGLGGNTNFAETQQTAENLSGSEAYAEAMKSEAQHNYITDPMLWYTRVTEQGDIVDWLMGKHNIPMEKFGFIYFYGGGNGASAIETLTPQAEELGVDIRMESRATALVLADEYTVTGIQYEDESGNVAQLNTKAGVLATGGVGNNLELLKWLGDQDIEKLAGVGSGQDGDGQMMVMQTAHGKASHICVSTFNPIMGTSEADSAAFDSWLATAACFQSSSLFVNQNGQRFYDESAGGSSAVGHAGICKLIESQGYAFAVCDDAAIDRWAAGEWSRANMMFREMQAGQVIDLRSELEQYKDADWYHQADTVQALGESIAEKVPAFDVDAFVKQIDDYNSYAESGVDAQWGKAAENLWPVSKAPLYAFQLVTNIHHTDGGIRINTEAQVIDPRGKAIDGLYAAGICTNWDTELSYGGTAQGVALWAGLRSARHIVTEKLGGTVDPQWMGDVHATDLYKMEIPES